jgi:predicted MFS family arabinose efflux permease
MGLVRRHPGFRLLWTGSTISSIGTWLLVIAVPVHVYELTGSAMATSAVPSIVGTGPELLRANAFTAATSATIRLTGPVAGSLLYLRGGLDLVVLLDVANYLAAAALVLAIRVPARVAEKAGLIGEMRAGLRYVWHSRLLRALLLTSWLFWTANAGLTALLVPFLTLQLGVPGAALGYLITALGLGYLTGSLLSRAIAGYPLKIVLMFCYAATGLGFLVLFGAANLTVALMACFACGIPGSLISVLVPHSVQSHTPDPLLGRASAAFGMSDAAAALTGALLAAGLAGWFSLGPVLTFFSLVTTSMSCRGSGVS